MNPEELSALILCCLFGGALLGVWLRGALPANHLDNETKDLVKLGVGLVGTMAALLLGLLVASTKSSYDARSGELTQMAANVILLDRLLMHYGPETAETRELLKTSVAQILDQIWPKEGRGEGGLGAQTIGSAILDQLQELVPRTDAQRALQSQAESIAMNLAQTRWLLFEQSGSSISTPFLIVVVFWLTTLFVSFGLFAPRNPTAISVLFVSALSVAGALFLILELDHPFIGVMQISSTPVRNALALIGK